MLYFLAVSSPSGGKQGSHKEGTQKIFLKLHLRLVKKLVSWLAKHK